MKKKGKRKTRATAMPIEYMYKFKIKSSTFSGVSGPLISFPETSLPQDPFEIIHRNGSLLFQAGTYLVSRDQSTARSVRDNPPKRFAFVSGRQIDTNQVVGFVISLFGISRPKGGRYRKLTHTHALPESRERPGTILYKYFIRCGHAFLKSNLEIH
ncbi:hypothetical protein QE152_g36992 [Popillia japonica]|uniref:Uncharacterized protein n=1 Tax=Popillia japonica TaxID=7064 RepID=A0AAW1IAY1_POPJA